MWEKHIFYGFNMQYTSTEAFFCTKPNHKIKKILKANLINAIITSTEYNIKKL